MSFILWLEAFLLFLAAVVTGLGAAGFTSNVVVWSTTIPTLAIRVGLGIFSAAFFAGAALCLTLWARRVERYRPFRQSGPAGLILITSHTLTQLAAGILARELPETPFRVRLRSRGDALSFQVLLNLPEDAEIPELARHLQELLTTELSRRTGLKIQEVEVVVHGTTRAQG